MVTRYFVLTSTRSGSTWFLTLLNGQPGVRAFGEIFLWRHVRPEMQWVAEGDPERFYSRRSALGLFRPRQLSRYLDEVEVVLDGNTAGGFKLIISHLRKVPELAVLLLARRYRLILLVRDNVFESTVSEMIALATNNPHGKAPSGSQKMLRLDPPELVRRIRQRRRGIRVMQIAQRLWPWPSVEVDYDELVRDQAAAMAPVLATLAVTGPPEVVASELTRRVARPYREIIENYDDVVSALRESGLGAYCPNE